MTSENEKVSPIKWLIAKRVRVNRENSAQHSLLFLGLGFPHKLKKKEKNSLFPDHSYGCFVQTGRAFTRHVVYGQDAFSALAHAVLALEYFLQIKCKECAIHDESGRRFDPSTDLVMLGAIGRRYLRANAKRNPNGPR